MDKPYSTPQEEAKYWRDAFWDMMYKKYHDLPVSVKLFGSEGEVTHFMAWWEDQLEMYRCKLLRSQGLEELNHRQAGMLMERDLIIRQLKEELQMKENTAEVLPFRLGNSSEPPIDKDWLSKLASGTRFLARPRATQGFILEDFVVASDTKTMDDYVFLGTNLNSRDGGFKWVDAKKFSQAYEFCMTLEVIEIKDGNSNKV